MTRKVGAIEGYLNLLRQYPNLLNRDIERSADIARLMNAEEQARQQAGFDRFLDDWHRELEGGKDG